MTKRAIALTLVICTAAILLAVLMTPKGSSAQAPPQVIPSGFSPSGTTDTSSMLRLTWATPSLPDGTPGITGFEVQYREDIEGADWTSHVFDSNATTAETTITGLKSNTAYWAQVRAVNADGPGAWSVEFWAMTTKKELTVAFSSATYTVGEGETATSTVTVTPTADRDVTVTIEITDGTGATLSDLEDNMLTIENGQSSASFKISGDDDDDEMNGEVTLTLTPDEYAEGLIKGTPYIAVVTVVDDEGSNSPPVIVATSTISVRENQTASGHSGSYGSRRRSHYRMVHFRRRGQNSVQPD